MITENNLRLRIKELKDKLSLYESLLTEDTDNHISIEDVKNDIKEVVNENISKKEARLQFLRAYQNLSNKDLLREFNKKFGTHYEKIDGHLYSQLTAVREGKNIYKDKTKINRKLYNITKEEKQEYLSKLKELLKQDLRHDVIAKKLGVHQVTVSRWISELNGKTRRKKDYADKYVRKAREEHVDYVKRYYLGTEDEREAMLNEVHKNKDNMSKYIYSIRINQHIKPEEVGLSRFPKSKVEFNNINYLKLDEAKDERLPIPDSYS